MKNDKEIPERDIHDIILQVKQRVPNSGVQQLQVKYPSDDDGIWYFYVDGLKPDIQIESSSGMCPFLVETNEQSSLDARTAHTVEAAVSMIVDYLSQLTESGR